MGHLPRTLPRERTPSDENINSVPIPCSGRLLGGRFGCDGRSDILELQFFVDSSTVQANGSDGAAGSVVLTPFSGTLTGGLPSAATITAVNLEALSSASANNPAQFVGAEYTLTMRLKDLSSGLTAAVTFEGSLNGTISAGSTSLRNTFEGQTEFSFNLNHHIYDISIGKFTAPTATGTDGLGSIGIDVSVRHNPEPSSFILAAFGLSAFGYFRQRRR